jgi:N-carbamoyl-L-amino-acid hydrolase
MMNRRTFITRTSLTALGITALGGISLSLRKPVYNNPLRINGQRLENRLTDLAKFGRDENGRGYRVAYTRGDIEARAWIMQLMKKAGLEVAIDEAGNISGKRKGKNAALKPIGFGSHIDMVPDGGNYDGTLGSLSALELIEVLNENNVVTEHPLEMIIFANEEGGLIGSRALVGRMTSEGLKQVSQSGLTMAEGIRAIGGNPDRIKNCIRQKGDLHAFVELHIEQGGILEKENLQIGIVEGIVGIVDWEVTVEGFANHAGTTPMDLRKDALIAASRFIIMVNEVIKSYPGNQVGTVGKIAVLPGAYNVIPGKVTLGLEIRDLSSDKIDMLFEAIKNRSDVIAEETGTKFSFVRQANDSKPAPTDKRVQQQILEAAKSLGLTTRFMQSGAGHDTQQMALLAPVWG